MNFSCCASMQGDTVTFVLDEHSGVYMFGPNRNQHRCHQQKVCTFQVRPPFVCTGVFSACSFISLHLATSVRYFEFRNFRKPSTNSKFLMLSSCALSPGSLNGTAKPPKPNQSSKPLGVYNQLFPLLKEIFWKPT